MPNLYLSHVFAGCLGIGLTFLWNYYMQVRKVYIMHSFTCPLYCVTINCNYFTRQYKQIPQQRTNTMYTCIHHTTNKHHHRPTLQLTHRMSKFLGQGVALEQFIHIYGGLLIRIHIGLESGLIIFIWNPSQLMQMLLVLVSFIQNYFLIGLRFIKPRNNTPII